MSIPVIVSTVLLASGCVLGAAPRCKEVAFKVSGTAMNRNITGLDFGNVDTLHAAFAADDFPRIPVSGSQVIAGWYCEPACENTNNTKLQFFLGGITTNREYWTAQGGTSLVDPPNPPYDPALYSWVDYANNLGYPTLALDHLGTGRSSRPDPILVTQQPYEMALYHDLVTQIKAGTTGQLPRAYADLTYIGQSYGSVLGNAMAGAYPTDFTHVILTGFTKTVLPSLGGVARQAPLAAATVMPARFAGLAPGYVTSSVEQARTDSFFGSHQSVDFDSQVAHLFYTREDVVSLGQFVSTYLNIGASPQYTGRVLVITGEQDQAFCGLGSSAIDPNPHCGTLLASTGSLYPNADYNYQSVPRTGHSSLLHLTAQTTLKVSHQFLAGRKFP
ncbi:alpha beta-hydrolase [Teratosphaeria destructans]|uniref:Alpha beta-hydrolase n=1 Tax=Teratosphaeria destructans TaxID=418781 RepID=A0A9W7SKA8_9PEZI|nr:alpha beta-hydrolase [Teratosphaeria destructans]